MAIDGAPLLTSLARILARGGERAEALRAAAGEIRRAGRFRWVGLYDVDHSAGLVSNLVWDGPGPPVYPVFPITRGLTGAAVAEGRTVSVGDVGADPRYLTALDSTRSEIIVPIRGARGVIGTIDVESAELDAFSGDVQAVLEACAEALRPLWE